MALHTTSSGLLHRVIRSRTNYWLALISDVLALIPFLTIGWVRFSGPPFLAGVLIALGFVTWSFIEYALHRWLLHGPPTMARRGHASHHADGQAYIGAPILLWMTAAWSVWAMLSLVLSVGAASLLVFGIYGGYNYYALVHHLQHHPSIDLERFRYGRRLATRHHLHHRRHVVNYGVTTAVWDRLLGTFEEVPTHAENVRLPLLRWSARRCGVRDNSRA